MIIIYYSWLFPLLIKSWIFDFLDSQNRILQEGLYSRLCTDNKPRLQVCKIMLKKHVSYQLLIKNSALARHYKINCIYYIIFIFCKRRLEVKTKHTQCVKLAPASLYRKILHGFAIFFVRQFQILWTQPVFSIFTTSITNMPVSTWRFNIHTVLYTCRKHLTVVVENKNSRKKIIVFFKYINVNYNIFFPKDHKTVLTPAKHKKNEKQLNISQNPFNRLAEFD